MKAGFELAGSLIVLKDNVLVIGSYLTVIDFMTSMTSSHHEYLYTVLIPKVSSYEAYFVTRHPKAFPANIRPFDSLSRLIWAAICLTYFMIITCSFVIFWKIKPYLPYFENSKNLAHSLFEILINPSKQYWQKIVQSGMLFSVLVAFNVWTINILYGIELRDSLIGQNFEKKVNSWADIHFFEAEFVQNYRDTMTSNSVPDWLHFDLYVAGLKPSLYVNRSKQIITYVNLFEKAAMDFYMTSAMNSSSPSNVVFKISE